MRAAIVDNEPHAREELGCLLAEVEGVEVVARCANAIEALHAVASLRPEVLFLDIRMPQVSGFELLGMIDEDVMPCVVFVTAYDEFALKAFEENALDYLLKPVEPVRLARAVEKVRRFLGEGRRPAYATPTVERVPCSGGRTTRLVEVAEIELVRSSAAGVYVVTAEGEWFTDLTLRVLETRAGGLVRCHRQYLVNPARVAEVLPGAGGAVLRTRAGHEVPASRRLLPRVKEALGLRQRLRS